MKRLALLLPLLALAAGCALRPDVAGSRWKSVSLKWTDRGGDAGKPEAAHWASLSDEESVERLRRAFPARPLHPLEASGRRRDHEILVETETGASFRVFFWDPHQSMTSRSRLTVLDSPRETPWEVDGPSADAFAEEVWLVFRSRGAIDLSFAELFSRPVASTPLERLALRAGRQTRLDGLLATTSPAASAPHAESAVPRPGEAGPLPEGAAERSEAGGVSHAEGAESESHAENAENAEL